MQTGALPINSSLARHKHGCAAYGVTTRENLKSNRPGGWRSSGRENLKGCALWFSLPVSVLSLQFVQQGFEILGHIGQFLHGGGGFEHAVAGFPGNGVNFVHSAGDFFRSG